MRYANVAGWLTRSSWLTYMSELTCSNTVANVPGARSSAKQRCNEPAPHPLCGGLRIERERIHASLITNHLRLQGDVHFIAANVFDESLLSILRSTHCHLFMTYACSRVALTPS
jgi:hypothetical protein